MQPLEHNQNIISIRIADFLKEFPPFSYLSKEDRIQLAQGVMVKYVDKGEVVFYQDQAPLDYFFVVNQGAIKLERHNEDENVLIDICDEGDLFGIRPLVADQPYLSQATAQEESILYCVHKTTITEIIENNPRASFFLAKTFATGSRGEDSEDGETGIIFLNRKPISQYYKLAEVQKVEITRAPITCSPNHKIEEAANIMTTEDVGSIIVIDEEMKPLGVITDSDLRRKVATYRVSRQASVTAIMQSPVLCITDGISIADAQIEMIKNNVSHLVITDDGTDDSAVQGVLAEHDLIVMQGNNPVVLIKEIKATSNPKVLKTIRDKADTLLQNYLYQEVAISFVSKIMTEITDALVKQCITIAIDRLRSAGKTCDASFCWLAIGSHGRGEQLIRTDQDHALLFDDVPIGKYKDTKDYFQELAQIAVDLLKECGYSYCPANMMASNPRWCLSLFEWKEQFSKWINNPNNESILNSSIFMDYRPVYGEEELAESLSEHIILEVTDNKNFLTFLSKSATETPPPLSFFRNFIVEKDGHNKNEFDIKQRGMLPLVDIARVLILESSIPNVNNTIERFQTLATHDPANSTLYAEASEAYEIMMKLRAKQGIENNDSGRFFDPKKLNKFERLLLRNGFKPISRLQEILNIRYQLKFIFR